MTASRHRLAIFGALVAAALLITGAQAALSAPSLPPITAEELLASTLERAVDPPPISGELAATLGLGLPVSPPEDSALADLMGESRLRVEHSQDGLRAALLGERSERLVVTDGKTLTTWDSRTLEATRRQLPAPPEQTKHEGIPQDLDPQVLSTRVLSLARAHADVTVDGTARVAGRAAYRLVVSPTDEGTTLGRAEVDIDADTHVPLRTALFARGADAASLEIAWTRVSFAPIDPATFDFTVPPGASVTQAAAPRNSGPASDPPASDRDRPGPLALLKGIADASGGVGPVTGDGFGSVVVLPLPERPSAARGERDTADGPPGQAGSEAGIDAMTAVLPLDGPLLSARLAEVDGQRFLLAGLVPLARLDDVAAALPSAAP